MRKEEILKAGGVITTIDGRESGIFKYPTLEAFIDACNQCPRELIDKSGSIESAEKRGSATYEAGVDIVRHGMNINHEAVHLHEFDVFHNLTTEIVEDVVGGSVNIGNYLEGIPENMFDFRMVENYRFIDVIFMSAESWDVDSDVIDNKATGVAYLVDKLESNGYRVRLHAFIGSINVDRGAFSVGQKEDEIILVTLKNYDEPLPIGQISGACSTSFLRRLEFRHLERFYYHRQSYGGAYGQKQAMRVLPEILPSGSEAILLPPTHDAPQFKLKTPAEIIAWAEHFSNHKITI